MAHKARRRRSLRRPGRLPWTVAIYLIDRAYGGSEEGGWYYTCGEPQDEFPVRRYKSLKHAAKACVQLDTTLINRLNEGRRPISSVLSTGRYSAIFSRGAPEPFPSTRPIYE